MAPRKLKGTDPKQAKPSKPKIMIFGQPGVGKTWASIDFPSVYYIDTEGGANLGHYTDKLHAAGGVYMGPDQGSNDMQTVLDEIITLATTDHNYRTLVIDSYSKIFNSSVAAEHSRMAKAGRDMEKTFGAEKKPAINLTRQWLLWFDRLDMNVILICHQKDKYVGGEVQGQTFDGWDKLEYELHLNLQIMKQGQSRKARIMKSRLTGFPDGEIIPWSHADFAERYGKDVIEAKATKVELTTPEDIARYNSLLSAVKVDQTVLDKWADNCERLEDLPAADMAKRIAYLNKLVPAAA
jgi:hypothetical protein